MAINQTQGEVPERSLKRASANLEELGVIVARFVLRFDRSEARSARSPTVTWDRSGPEGGNRECRLVVAEAMSKVPRVVKVATLLT